MKFRLCVTLIAAAASFLMLGPVGEAGAANRCKQAKATLVANISEGLEPGLSLRNVKVVRSRDFQKAYFVAGDLEGSGLDGDSDIAVWVTNKSSGIGLTFSVNAAAKQFSSWGSGGSTDAQFSMSDDGASASESCARK